MAAVETIPARGTTELVLSPRRASIGHALAELWEFRELLYFLTWRDVKVRYKQTALGVAWAVLQPLLTMLVFTIFFGRVANVSSGGIPYPVFAYAALLPWTYFQTATNNGAGAIVSNSTLVTKLYVPRMSLVISPILASLLDFALAFVLMLALMAWYGIAPGVEVLSLPLFMLLLLATTYGASALLAALNVRYRDVRYTIPFLLQLLLFVTPVAYSAAGLKQPWLTLYGLNPLVTVVEGFRWALVNGPAVPLGTALVSAASGLVLLLGGAWYFHRTQRSFADVI